ncbi:E3 ubiquitin-protein ligase XB3 [Acorus calamus]|uniref:RING-type E3 ubiquitin transferase n=1 Tax=Acorus calamus TaxID=4465 RepID=A0AAV9DEF7_ACOCL|nr:E3 ubiquitin-protein ligase XB3 [Acorus calamus]
MGQGLSCNPTHDHHFFRAVQTGDLESVECMLQSEPSIIHHTTAYERLSALHIAAANGRMEVLCLVLDRLVNPDLLNRNKQTPLMLAAMHGKISCVQKLIEAGANRREWSDASASCSEAEKAGLRSFSLRQWSSRLCFDRRIWDNETDLCCICFDQVCTIEVQDCGHQMCAHCTLALCCHSKPNPVTSCMPSPVCPFCRSNIARLVVAKSRDEEKDKENQSKSKRGPRRSRNLSEGSSSFKGLSSAMGSFGKRGSGRVADEPDKP